MKTGSSQTCKYWGLIMSRNISPGGHVSVGVYVHGVSVQVILEWGNCMIKLTSEVSFMCEYF